MTPGVASCLSLAVVFPITALAAPTLEIPVDVELEWESARVVAHPGWEPGPGLSDRSADLVRASALEQGFDLAEAQILYLDLCAGTAGDWASWETACEGAIRTAFGLDAPDTLDRALLNLLARRPDHDLAAGRFPPGVLERAEALRQDLPRASLEIADTVAEVSLDGLTLGVSPLLLPDLVAGEHQIRCNGWSHTFHASEADVVALACPAPAEFDAPLPFLVATRGTGTTLAEVTAGGHGMDSGLWVFYGAEEASALLVHEPATGPGPWLQAVRCVRSPAEPVD